MSKPLWSWFLHKDGMVCHNTHKIISVRPSSFVIAWLTSQPINLINKSTYAFLHCFDWQIQIWHFFHISDTSATYILTLTWFAYFKTIYDGVKFGCASATEFQKNCFFVGKDFRLERWKGVFCELKLSWILCEGILSFDSV